MKVLLFSLTLAKQIEITDIFKNIKFNSVVEYSEQDAIPKEPLAKSLEVGEGLSQGDILNSIQTNKDIVVPLEDMPIRHWHMDEMNGFDMDMMELERLETIHDEWDHSAKKFPLKHHNSCKNPIYKISCLERNGDGYMNGNHIYLHQSGESSFNQNALETPESVLNSELEHKIDDTIQELYKKYPQLAKYRNGRNTLNAYVEEENKQQTNVQESIPSSNTKIDVNNIFQNAILHDRNILLISDTAQINATQPVKVYKNSVQSVKTKRQARNRKVVSIPDQS
ncbi:hypothetical protein HDV01_002761 [Terramyces sp. JEL0728]|nr:hypothetical protein HDV01_002761 [Terramyces sp. JEL0728]